MERALDVNQALLALGSEVVEGEGATFVRNRAAPLIRDANHAANVRAATAAEIERLLARMEEEYGGWCGHRRIDVDFRTPPELEARLALDGYRREEALVMLLKGELRGPPPAHDIREVTSKEQWSAYERLREIDWRAYVERQGRRYDESERESKEQMLLCVRAKAPAVRHWLAYAEGEPQAYMCSWPGTAGTGQVEDLFTHPEFRHRGLATALIHRCVADCRSRGAGPVVIVADPTDTPKQMYAALGFRPVALLRHWWKRADEAEQAGGGPQ